MTTAGLYRDTASVNDTLAADTANFGNLPWREVFTDPQLQTLIEQALTNNGDLRSAALNVKQAQAALMSARLAYAPSAAGTRERLHKSTPCPSPQAGKSTSSVNC